MQPLQLDQGLLREALTSLYSLFESTRQILHAAGPNVGAARNSIGGIAIAVLNRGLRPFLSKWHPQLQAWEARRDPQIDPEEHERRWDKELELRKELEALGADLMQYAQALAKIAGVEID